MISIALSACLLSPEIAQSSACVYAASLSRCSALQPRSGLEYGPHSHVFHGCGTYEIEPSSLDFAASYADFHGSSPARTFPLTQSSCARFTSTPGCRNPADERLTAGGAAAAGNPASVQRM